MLHKLITPGALLCLLILCSCGASKKAALLQNEVKGLNDKVTQLEQANNQLQSTNTQLQQQLTEFKTQRQAALDAFSKYKSECEYTQAKLQAAQRILVDQYATMQELENKIEEALANFADKGVDVYYKNGFVLVSLEDNLLYKSGSAALGAEGKKALSSLAAVLNDYPNLKIVIVGNTDDAQFKKGKIDNWTLSTERANGVVRTFRDDYKIDPVRLTAAGKAKYNPVADNSTAEGRAKNRRTDIILNPDLDKLWESIKENK